MILLSYSLRRYAVVQYSVVMHFDYRDHGCMIVRYASPSTDTHKHILTIVVGDSNEGDESSDRVSPKIHNRLLL